MVVLALGAAVLVAVPPSARATVGPDASVAAPVLEASVLAAEQDTGVPAPRPTQVASPGSVAPVRPAAPALPQATTTARPGTAAAVAVEFALAQRGLPYVWGGNGPQQGHRGFDCSGLTTYSYRHAGITLPRTAHTQYHAGPHVPADAELLPGDLVFYGVPQRVHHVGLYIGNGQMVAAPTFGKPVRISYVRYTGDDYLGATRPAAGRDADLLATPELPVVVPPLPSPEIPPAPEEFAAPEVPADLVVEPPVTLDEDVRAFAAQAEGVADAAPGLRAPDGPVTASGVPTSADPTPPATPPPPRTPGADTWSDDGSGTPSAGAAPPSETTSAEATSAAEETSGAAPTGAAPPMEAPPTEASPTDASPTDASSTEASSTEASSTEASSGAAPTGAAPTGAAGIAEGGPEPVLPEPVAEVATPVAVVLPGGTEIALAGAERDERGLPVTPEAAGTGGLRWSPAEEGRAARAVVAVGSDGVSGIEVGSGVGLRGADGGVVELTVRSRDLVAGDVAFPRGDGTRLVLVVVDPGTGGVLVLIAE